MTTVDAPAPSAASPSRRPHPPSAASATGRFHLNQRNDTDGKDCGDVWIDEQYLSLRFACFNCLGRPTAANEPPVGHGH